jgi:hypothetical protein
MKTALLTRISGLDHAHFNELRLRPSMRHTLDFVRRQAHPLLLVEARGVTVHPEPKRVGLDLIGLSTCNRLQQNSGTAGRREFAGQRSVGACFDQPAIRDEATDPGAFRLRDSRPGVALVVGLASGRACRGTHQAEGGSAQCYKRGHQVDFTDGKPMRMMDHSANCGTCGSRRDALHHDLTFASYEFMMCKSDNGSIRITLNKQIEMRCLGLVASVVEGVWRMLRIDKVGSSVIATRPKGSVDDIDVPPTRVAGFEFASGNIGVVPITIERMCFDWCVGVIRRLCLSTEVGRMIFNPKKACQALGLALEITLAWLDCLGKARLSCIRAGSRS